MAPRRGSSRGRWNTIPTSDDEWLSIDWSAHTHDAPIRGHRIRYADIGSGPAIILIHGQGGSSQWWLRIMPTVARHVRIIAVDLAGFGESEPLGAVGADDVMTEHAESIVGLMDHLGLARATLVGHSMGGLVCTQIACDHPHRLSGLLLTNAGGGPLSPQRLRFIVMAFGVFNAIFAVSWVPGLIARSRLLRAALFALAVNDTASISKPLGLQIVPRLAAPGFMLSLHGAAVAVNHMTPQAVRSPCLIVWGQKDRILPESVGRALAANIPGAEFVLLDNVGHCPMIEMPEQFSRLLLDFASNTADRRSPAQPESGPAKRPSGE